ncbi:uncharacterized protein At3g17950 [Cryptomeria japonica]|uniref:uncharacterized protein At3g17950 n=1 Tax=Cryptomeria japonica TaxID=3369 RepID=UPI0025ABE779|nr:uncharacterized protein At3g17950 [Cryptomeria japonica]XP_059065953.1 uncharacterized protein At3g17950 [Cryptomeria japonica]
MENHVLTEPNAFNTLIAVSPSFSSDSSSDLDTESTGSFFYDKSITLGNLIGLPPDLAASGRDEDGQEHRPSVVPKRHKRNSRCRSWWGLCGSCSGECNESNMPPSLGQFLEVERRAAASNRREKLYFNIMYDEYTAGQINSEGPNALFANGQILPPHSADHFFSENRDQSNNHPAWVPADWFSTDANSGRSSERSPGHHRSLSLGSRVPTFFSGICGRTSIEA